jgi:hypothetical protein
VISVKTNFTVGSHYLAAGVMQVPIEHSPAIRVLGNPTEVRHAIQLIFRSRHEQLAAPLPGLPVISNRSVSRYRRYLPSLRQVAVHYRAQILDLEKRMLLELGMLSMTVGTDTDAAVVHLESFRQLNAEVLAWDLAWESICKMLGLDVDKVGSLLNLPRGRPIQDTFLVDHAFPAPEALIRVVSELHGTCSALTRPHPVVSPSP